VVMVLLQRQMRMIDEIQTNQTPIFIKYSSRQTPPSL
jgi:hypothetical protein